MYVDDRYVHSIPTPRGISPLMHSSQSFVDYTREIIEKLIQAERTGRISKIDITPNYYGEYEVKITWREEY